MSEHADYHVAVDPDAVNNPHAAAIRMVGSGKRVLEVGCWSGHVTEHLVHNDNTVVGVELDAGAAALAARHTERIHVADLETTPLSHLEQGPFDVVMLCDVLEHMRRPTDLLDEACRLVAPGGRLVISVPNVAHVDVRAMLALGEWRYQDDGVLDRTHLRWFTRRSLHAMLTDAGLTAVSIERVRTPFGTSNHLTDPGGVPSALVELWAADPESNTLQFVVAAERTTETSAADQLADDPTIAWPSVLTGTAGVSAAHYEAVVTERDALRNEVDAWRRSTMVRVTAPLRAVRQRLARR